jgi:hypothetical protein
VAEPDAEPIGFVPVRAPSTFIVGRADDPAEHAADRMADVAMARIGRQTGPVAAQPSRASATGPDQPAIIGREGGALDPTTHAQVQHLRGGGAPLPEATRARLETAFGTDLGGVRVHSDTRAAHLSSTMSARAFTVGSDMFFGAGQFRPDTPAGEHTLAHEVAHVVQGGGSAARRVHRLYDMREKQPLGLAATQSIGTVGNRQVWFFGSSDDTVVVKLEDQPLGLNQLATHVHATLTKASTVQTKKLQSADRATVRGMISAGRLTSGSGWEKAQSGDLRKADFPDLSAYGRAVHLAAIDSRPDDPMIAMTVASGKSIKDLQDPSLSYEKDGTAPIRKVLTEPKMLRQLGELSAVDLFIGNRDRVLSGNLGNWFYTPDREMTVIDNVDAQMTKYLTGVGEEPKAADPLAMLAGGALVPTAKELVDSVVNVVKNDERMMKMLTLKGGTYEVGDKEKQKEWMGWVNANRAVMDTEVLAGLKSGRKRIIATMTSTKFSNRGKRGAKKAIKAQAALATQRDSNHSQTDYYDLLKNRANWLASH